MNIELKEFKNKIKEVNNHRIYSIKNSLGVYDAYKYYRKNRPKDKQYILSESQYFSIIRKVNLLLLEQLLDNNDIILPCRMGTIELRKFESTFRIDDNGKVKTNLPIDWNKTLELWYEDEEAYYNRTLIKMEENEIFKIYYNKINANYENKVFYEFIFNRALKQRLKTKIKQGLIDAYLLKRKEKLNGK